jgi:hypothetical protein
MSIVNGPKIITMVSAANGDTYGDGERHELRTQQALIQGNVKGGLNPVINTPPGSPVNGDTYIVGPAPTGLWLGQANAVAYWAVDPQDGPSITPNIATGAWEFYAPLAGWLVYDTITTAAWRYNGTIWVLANIAARKVINVTATGALALDASQGNVFANTLTGNVTSVTISNPTDGQIITLIWSQGGTAFTVSYTGSTFRGATTIGATINTKSVQQFTYDAATSSWLGIAAANTNI